MRTQRSARWGRVALVAAFAAALGMVSPGAVAGAAPAGSWSVQPTPPLRQPTGSFSGIACPTADFCEAVGSAYEGIDTVSVAEEWDGTAWRVQTTPRPVLRVELTAVSCTSPTFCMAVGYTTQDRDEILYAAEWNGAEWRTVPTANPPGVTSVGYSAVSCTSPTFCVAVGTSGFSTGGSQAVAYAWDGSSWARQTLPDAIPGDTGQLFGVSCVSASWCMSDGYYQDGINQYFGLADVWNGSAWSVAPWAGGSAGSADVLNRAISCASPSMCEAVGNGFVTTSPSVAGWNGATWSAQTPPPSVDGFLVGVSCPAATACQAVGSNPSSATGVPIAAGWNGSSWVGEAVPDPDPEGSDGLAGVSCDAVGQCTAVGSKQPAGARDQVLAESWDGSAWTLQPALSPPEAVTSSFNSVSCASPTFCVAVGTSGYSALAERWDGYRWTVTPVAVPGVDSALDFVSCPSSTFCMAVGYSELPGSFVGVDALWNGTSWTETAQTDASGADVGGITGLSCVSNTFCIGVGSSGAGSFEQWDGTYWTAHAAPLSGRPTDVSCTSATACEAVGYDVVSGTWVPAAAGWNGTTWSEQPVPAGGLSGTTNLTDVSCAAPDACEAIGSAPRASFSEHWDGTAWTLQATPAVGSYYSLSGISCVSSTRCEAVGRSTPVSGPPVALTDVWAAGRWSIQPDPPQPAVSDLTSVSCLSARACQAVGSQSPIPASELTAPFVERYRAS